LDMHTRVELLNVMINFICQLGWVTGYPGNFLNNTLGHMEIPYG
jgi:hypothetical protein